MTEQITKTFTITTTPELINRLERFFALLHFNSNFGHSNLFGMWLDGDGPDRFKVDGVDVSLSPEVSAIGGVGYGMEIAGKDCYGGQFIDRNRNPAWDTAPPGDLFKDGKIIKRYRLSEDGRSIRSV